MSSDPRRSRHRVVYARLLPYVACSQYGAHGDDHCLGDGGRGRRKRTMDDSHRARWEAAADLRQAVSR